MTDTREATEEGATNFLAVVPEHRADLVLLDPKARKALFDHIEKEVAERTFDLSTDAGRVECRKFAASITRTKTTLDETAKKLTEEWRLKTAAVNAERKPIVDRLAELAKQARAPLTEWETAEETRLAKIEQTIKWLNDDATVSIEATAADVRLRITRIEAVELDEAIFRGALQAAQEAKIRTLNFLRATLERLEREEADRAELARLREEAEARKRADEERERQEREAREAEEARLAEEKAAREAAEREAAAADERRQREAEAARQAAERAEQARLASEEQAKRLAETAAARAKAEAEEQARAAAEAERQRHEAEIQAERDRAAAAERQAEEERQRTLQEARIREEQVRAEQVRREKAERDEAHRTLCKREAKLALMTVPGVDERIARDIVVLILANEVPRTTLDFAAEPRVVSAREAFEESRADAPEAEAVEHRAELPLC